MEPSAKQKSIKIAHLLLAHHQPVQVKRLLQRIMHPQATCFIHVDKKANEEKFRNVLMDCGSVQFVSPAYHVNWGGYSIIKATLAGFKQILKDELVTHINLLSGADYPVQPAGELIKFLQNNPDSEFFEYYPMENGWHEGLQRFKKYHFNELNFPGKYIAQRFLNSILPPRKMPDDMIPVGRLQWFTITRNLAAYLLDTLERRKDFVRFFKLCWGTDEFLFQTLAYNSAYRHAMVNRSLRYVEFQNGQASPKTLDMADFETLASGNYFFARKFDYLKSADLLTKIDKELLNPG